MSNDDDIITLVANDPHIQALHRAFEDGALETVVPDDLP